MTDLNKERELCNQSFEKYWDDFCEAYGNGFDRSLAKLFFANAWGEAKAQAVPEGYCLVPKTPTQKMIDGSHGLCLPQDVYKAMLRLNEFKAQDKVIIEGYKRVWNIDTINSNGFHATTINKPTRCLIHVFGDQHVRHATNEEIRESSESGAEG